MKLRSPLAAFALLATSVSSAPLAAQCVPNELCPLSSITGQVNYATAANFDGAAGGGNLVVSGIPAGATILSARFYCEASSGTTATGAAFGGAPILLTQVGFGFGSGVTKHGRSYASNVTGAVTGNGIYPYIVAGGVNNGAGLVVVYEDTSLVGEYQIELHEGYNPGLLVDASDGAWPNSTVFSGFTVDPSAVEAELSFFVMNALPGPAEEYLFQGASLDCCDPADGLFEFERYDVSSFLSGGETSATLDITEMGGTIGIASAIFRTRIGTAAVNYCTAGTSANGCQGAISAVGTASATASSGFSLIAANVEGATAGLFLFSDNGRQANSWGNGTSFQCVVPPVFRGGTLTATGTPGLCDGVLSQDLNAVWCPTCPKPAKNLGAGALVQAQTWYRDPFSTSNQTTSFSDAIEFLVQP